MNAEARSQVHQTLLSRRHAITDDWHKAIARTSFVPLKAVEVRQHLVELTEEVIALLLTEPLDHGRVEAIGASLANFHYLEPEALGGMQEVLARQLVEGLRADQVVALQPRLAALLGRLATGFSQQARETVLDEQDWIRGALMRELRRAQEGLQKAHDELESKVQGRTIELIEANEQLKREIAERKRMEKALRHAARQWHTTFDAIGDAVCLLDLEGRIQRCNEAMARLLEKRFSDIVGHKCWELVHGTSEAIEECPVVRMRETCRRETMILPRDDRWFDISADPVLDEDGDLIGAVHIMSDITERRRAEEALRESEERYRSLFEGVPVGLYRTTTDQRFLDVNLAMVKMLGYPDKDSLLATPTSDLQPNLTPEERQRRRTLLERNGAIRDLESRLRRRDGSVIWAQSNFRTVRDTDGQVLYYEGSLEDITERKRAEEALQKAHGELERRVEERTAELAAANEQLRQEIEERKRAEEELIRLSSAVKTSVDSIVIIDVAGKVIDINEAVLKMYGVDDKGDLIGQQVLDLIAPEHREKALAGIEFVLEEGYDKSQDYDVITKDGDRTPVELSAAVMKDADGKPRGIVIIARDITERKRAEEHLIRTERLAAVGRLAATLAHEINNPLQGISNSLELALDFPLEEKERQKYLLAARGEIDRLATLVGHVLDSARPPQFKLQPVSAALSIHDAMKLARKQLDHSNIQVSVDLLDPLPLVLASASQLCQVFLNLIINAIEAMPDGGKLNIAARLVGEQVEVTFTDTGPGIPPDVMARLFEPFYTTKENGTGLGLSVSHSIIQQHGGTLTADNVPSSGAVFTVALPITSSEKPHLADRS